MLRAGRLQSLADVLPAVLARHGLSLPAERLDRAPAPRPPAEISGSRPALRQPLLFDLAGGPELPVPPRA